MPSNLFQRIKIISNAKGILYSNFLEMHKLNLKDDVLDPI